MKILLDILILLIGFAALVKGADWFVEGSAEVARRFRIPGVIIGLTIVAMGTSAPELAVSTAAAIGGSNEIAISNVAGSNLFNLLVVLGVCAIIHAVPVGRSIVKRDYPVNLGITVVLLLFIGLPGLLGGTLVTDGTLSEAMRAEVGTVSRTFRDLMKEHHGPPFFCHIHVKVLHPVDLILKDCQFMIMSRE